MFLTKNMNLVKKKYNFISLTLNIRHWPTQFILAPVVLLTLTKQTTFGIVAVALFGGVSFRWTISHLRVSWELSCHDGANSPDRGGITPRTEDFFKLKIIASVLFTDTLTFSLKQHSFQHVNTPEIVTARWKNGFPLYLSCNKEALESFRRCGKIWGTKVLIVRIPKCWGST